MRLRKTSRKINSNPNADFEEESWRASFEEIRHAIRSMDDNTFNSAQAMEEQSIAICNITSSAAKAAGGADEVIFNIPRDRLTRLRDKSLAPRKAWQRGPRR